MSALRNGADAIDAAGSRPLALGDAIVHPKFPGHLISCATLFMICMHAGDSEFLTFVRHSSFTTPHPSFCLQSRPAPAASLLGGNPAIRLCPRPWRPHRPRQRGGGGHGDAAPKLSERTAAASAPRVRHGGRPKARRAAGVCGARRSLGFGR